MRALLIFKLKPAVFMEAAYQFIPAIHAGLLELKMISTK